MRLLILVIVSCLCAPTRATADAPKVCLQPLGRHDAALLEVSKRGIEYLYGLAVEILPGVPLPKAAYYPPRRRYRADRLLDHLNVLVAKTDCDLIMGFTSVDISTTKGSHKDWGIFGLAFVGGPSGVVSSYRLRRRASRKKRKIRVVKVVNHELGHALGTGHVAGRGCLMADAAGTVKTVDAESGLLCDTTRRFFERRNGFSIPKRSAFDWPQLLAK